MTTQPRRTTSCAICGQPRADHGNSAYAGTDGVLGPQHEYQAPAATEGVRHA